MNDLTNEEMPSEEAQAFAETIREWNEKNGTEPESGEPVLAETAEGPETTDESEPATAGPTPEAALWQNVIATSAEAQRRDEEVDFVEDKLSVKLTDFEILARGRMNAERTSQRKDLEKDLETKRAEAKAIKSEIDELQAEIDQCSTEIGTGRALVAKRWRVVTDWQLHEERWHDPDDGRLVRPPNPIPSNRKQVALPFAETTSGAPPSADDVEFDDEGDGDEDEDEGEEDDESPVLEDRLDRAIEEADTAASATPSDGDPADDDDVEIDGLAILEGAPPEPVVSEPPAKPSRRARKTKQ